MKDIEPRFTAHVATDHQGAIQRILVQDTSDPNEHWFRLVISIEAEDIIVYVEEDDA